MNFLARLDEGTARCGLNRQEPLLAGVSGGVDSLVLLHGLHALGYRLVVAHFDHGLRPESGAEARFVAQEAARLGLPFVGGSGDVRGLAADEGRSLEEAARLLRYRFLFAQAEAHGAQAVVVGHQADDQVETVLMHLARGSGLSGLRGMRWRTLPNAWHATIPLVRPLLGLWRNEILDWAQAQALSWREDSSNASPVFARNRLRQALQAVNPAARQAVWRLTQTLDADLDFLSEQTERAWQDVLRESGEGWLLLDATALSALPPALSSRVWRQALHRLGGDWPDWAAVQRAANFLQASAVGSSLSLPGGLILRREGVATLSLRRAEALVQTRRWPQMPPDMAVLPLRLPEERRLAGRWFLTLRIEPATAALRAAARRNPDPYQAWLAADGLEALSLRRPVAGLRFQPFGMDGKAVKLQDIFTNLKIPAYARAAWPLLFSGENLVWVPGYRLAESVRIAENTRMVCLAELKWRSDESV